MRPGEWPAPSSWPARAGFGSMRTKRTAPGQTVPLRARKTTQQPRVLAAPDMLDRKLIVTREDGESDARYQSRCALFDTLLENARRD